MTIGSGGPPGARTRQETILAHLARDPSGLVVVCDHAERRHRARTLRLDACLAEVPVWWLLDLALAGGTAWLDVDQCTRAAAREDLHRIATLVGPSRLQLGTTPGPGGRGALLEERRPPVDRRTALGLRPPPAPSESTHSPDGDSHTRLLESLAAAGVVDQDLADSPALALAATGCTACGVCVRACPHEALSLTHEGGTSVLVHRATACRGERQCVTHCPVDALQTTGTIGWAELVAGEPHELARVPTRRCERCRSRFPDDDRALCHLCRARTGDPFGVHLPDHVLARLGRGADGRRLQP
ncbi:MULTISPECIES: 4Fe-4S dicluster domain-containing protein [unclassified Luteococcus]|uniref:4Fe-4S dicluster domain-containing protein n=1 Tax=unclassified Luteococcus TaxID=2639923 RepID=UPI00313C52E4